MVDDPYKYFRIEGREILDDLGKGLLELERGAGDSELVKRLLRGAHTLKGAARVVKQKHIAELTHAVEEVLAPFRDANLAVPRDRVDAALKLVDDIAARLSALDAGPPTTASAAVSAKARAEEQLRFLRADTEELDAVVDGAAESHAQLAALRRSVSNIDRIRDVCGLLLDQLRVPGAVSGVRGAASNAIAAPAQAAFENALASAEELADLLARLERSTTVGMEQLDVELRQLRDAAERVRLVPVSVIFTAVERTARDVAQSLGKRVVFHASGGETRLDGHVLALLQSALVQVVRNAVAHGIEGEQERTAARKPAEGRVTLEVKRIGGQLSLVCHDDGRGVDVDGVRRAVERRGALPAGAERLSADELLQVLLRGGITTSATVTSVSGRGVGLDVVRDAVARLQGAVSVRSDQRGGGTSLEILVPVSLAGLHALTVEAGAQRASIPVSAVRTTLRIADTDIVHTADGDTIQFAEAMIPFAPLERTLRARRGVSDLRARRSSFWSAVVIDGGTALAAIGVDRLIGTTNVVVRAVPPLTPADPIVAGTLLDADGNPQIVLDPQAIVARVRSAKPSPGADLKRRAPILIVDDSLTTRMLEQSILESAGYDVDLAVSGEEAIRKARQTSYALFLVDVEMPGMSGFDFIALIRADAGLRELPAILVTSRGSPEDRQHGVDVGANAYIVKSEFDQNELLDLIRKLAR